MKEPIQEYKRTCSICKKIIIYKNKSTFNIAEKRNSNCLECKYKKHPTAKRKELLEKIKNFHTEGLTNRQIGKELNLYHTTIGTYIRNLNLVPNGKFLKIEMIDEFNAKCNKCHIIQPIDQFQIQRRGTLYEYRMAYCRGCRKKQLNNAINKNVEKYIKAIFNKTKRDRLSKNIIFTVTFEEFYLEYQKSNNKCFYTDKEFTLLSYGLNRRGKRERMSVDRIIPELGYIKENIVFCLTHVNAVKNDCTLQEIKDWMPGFYDRIFNKIKNISIFKSYI